jgi:hypothetical protein
LFDDVSLLFYSKNMNHLLLKTDNHLELARRLRRLTWVVRGLLMAAAPLVALEPIWLLLAPDSFLALGWGRGEPYAARVEAFRTAGVSAALAWRLAGASLVDVLVGLASIWQLWRLFAEYRQGRVFSARALQHLRRFGWSLVAVFAASPISEALFTIALSWDQGPGHREVAVSFTGNDYGLLLLALVFVTLARVMQEAARVAEENESFV